jgi:ParB family chromosome partitioning protein
MKVAKDIIEQGLSVREAEGLAKEPKKKNTKISAAISPDMQIFLNTLQSAFGTKVVCKSSKKDPQKGILIINYSSYADLTRIQQAINTI